MNQIKYSAPSLLASLVALAAALTGLSCSQDVVPPGVPECRILSQGLDLGLVVRPQGDLPNSVVSVPVNVRSVLTIRTEGGQEDLSGRVAFRITSDFPVPPVFVIPEIEDSPDFILEPEQNLMFTLQATVTGETTSGVHTGVLDFGETCGEVGFRIEVVGWDEEPPVFVTMWGDEGDRSGEFQSPNGAAVDSQGRVYVADAGNHRVEIFDSEGTYLHGWRSINEELLFRNITDIAIDTDDIVYVADHGFEGLPRISLFHTNGDRFEIWDRIRGFPLVTKPGRIAVRDRMVFMADPAAGNVAVIAGNFETFGLEVLRRIGAKGDRFSELGEPRGVAVDGKGHVFVSDAKKHAIFVFSEEGEFLYRFGEEGSIPGRLNKPAGILYSPDGFLYVVDELNVRVQKFTPEGAFLSLWGHPGYLAGAFYHPLDVARSADGSFYVVEEGHHRIQRFRYETNGQP